MAGITQRVRTSDPVGYSASGEEAHAVIRERVAVEVYPSVSFGES